MIEELRPFSHQLEPTALHVDYLRLRCGQEQAFERKIKPHKGVSAHIAFSEWDVVLFVPSVELYPSALTEIYSDSDIADTITGCTGYFNYLWHHDINSNWTTRLLKPEATIALLVSLRFTDRFRSTFGIGAELLLCDFLHRQLGGLNGDVSAIVAHSVGWNDATVILKAKRKQEHRLVDALTLIRYATERQLLVSDGDPAVGVIAATYSHVLGNLLAYRQQKLTFGSFHKNVKAARLLIRVNPDVEPGLRDTLAELVKKHKGGSRAIGSELGHYNFSADITSAFRSTQLDAVHIIQGFRVAIRDYMLHHQKLHETSFPETTTEITFKETINRPVAANASVHRQPRSAHSSPYTDRLRGFLRKDLKELKDRASPMTRHRLAILLVTVLTYLDDPVRGSVVGHLCRFLETNLREALQRSDRASHDDLCHVLEYALHQAIDGLNQFQHDANSLGLSGRGGYNRLIQAVEEFIHQVTQHLDKGLTPLITFGLRSSGEEPSPLYWIDVPFSTAFVTERWHILLHDVARLCWQRAFEWRLDAYDVWQEFSTNGILLPRLNRKSQKNDRNAIREEMRQLFLLGRDVVTEVFPSYVILHLVAGGDLKVLDDLVIAKEFMTRSHPLLTEKVMLHLVLHVLLDLHERARIGRGNISDPMAEPTDPSQRNIDTGRATEWWNLWAELSDTLQGPGKGHPDISGAMIRATSNLSKRLVAAKQRFKGRDAAETLNSAARLVCTPTFKKMAQRSVAGALHLLAIRWKDYHKRPSFQPPTYDPSMAEFGHMLRSIDKMRNLARHNAEDMHKYRQAIEQGTVFASPLPASSVACFLAATENQDEDGLHHRLMMSSLSSILSLWHSAVTRTGTSSGKDLLQRLTSLGVVERV